jgi:competence protein ComEC
MHRLRAAVGAVAMLFMAGVVARAQSDTLLVSPTATPCLVVRAGPTTDAAKRTCMVPGTRVLADSSVPYWRWVTLPDGTQGWSAKKFLVGANDPDTTKWLEVDFVDVGQGDGILIRTADDHVVGNDRYDGRTIVIDGGPNKQDATNAMYQFMASALAPATPIDALIVTHPHDDHYPGAWGLLAHYPVNDYYDSGFPAAGVEWSRFMTAMRGAKGAAGAATRLHIGAAKLGTPDWGSELKAEFLYAYPGDSAGLGTGNTLENNASIVLKLTYGEISFLFMGDAEGKERGDPPSVPKYVEARLLAHPERLKANVLKIAHHGSETSSTLPFINAVDPDYVVVMSGRKKFSTRFLPDSSALQRYCDHKASTRILRTDQDDAKEGRTSSDDADGDNVVIRTNGVRIVVEAHSNGKPIIVDACDA